MDKIYQMVEPAFTKSATRTDMEALWKRACFLVVSKKYYYVKEAAVDKVVRFRNLRGSMLTQEGGEIYMDWKKNGTMPPVDELRSHMDAEQRILNRILQGRPRELPRWGAGRLALGN